MLVVDKHKSVRSFGDMMVVNTFLTVLDRLSHSPHPNISRLVESYSSPKHLYVCLQLAGPQTLFSRLCQRDSPSKGTGSLAIASVGMQSLAAQVSAAVCHLHLAADVCHRDIKPENISVMETDPPPPPRESLGHIRPSPLSGASGGGGGLREACMLGFDTGGPEHMREWPWVCPGG